MTNHLVNTSNGNSLTFAQFVKAPAVIKSINSNLGSEEAGRRFLTAITSAVVNNPALSACDNSTIITAGLQGEALKLSPSLQMGQYYIVPFNDNKNGRVVGTFQLGYKGYLQLAMRSGQYRHINVMEVKEGELISSDPFNEEYTFKAIQNPSERRKAKTVGYYAMLELVNGFKKSIYWDKEQMEEHALTYSKGYKAKKGYTFWEKNFDEMAKKTLIRQLISKWGVMSIEMQMGYERDMTVTSDDGKIEYFDSVDLSNEEQSEVEEGAKEIGNAPSQEVEQPSLI